MNDAEQKKATVARAATLEVLKETMLPNFLDPVPCDVTLRGWFDEAGIPRMKTNPAAKRGGGVVYYSVSAVEKFLRGRVLPAHVGIGLRARSAVMG